MRTKLVRWAWLAVLVGCGGERAAPSGDESPGVSGAGAVTATGGGGPSGTGGDNSGAGNPSVGGSSSGSGGSAGPRGGSGTAVDAPESAARTAARAALDTELAELAGLDADSLRERYPTHFEPAPSYAASEVAGLDLIQGSSLGLTDAETT